MASQEYKFSIANNTLNELANCNRLESEILSNQYVITALDYIHTSGDDLFVWMKADIISGKTWEGAWSSQTTYNADEIIVYGGVAYLCILESTNNEPPNATYWTAQGSTTQIGALCALLAAHTGAEYYTQEPHSPDGRRYFIPSSLKKGLTPKFIGYSDDVTNGTKYNGSICGHSSSSIDDHVKEIQFINTIDLIGGKMRHFGAKYGDYVKYEIYAPATAGTSNPGAGAYDKYAIGGGVNMFIPNGTTTGDWDLNLTETLNANVSFTKVCPIPVSDSSNPNGWFDYNIDTNVCSFNALQKGYYNLFDANYTLLDYVKIPILGDTSAPLDFTLNVASKTMLPHWKHKVTVHQTTTNLLEVIWWYEKATA